MIGECKECGFRAGFFGLTDGFCKPCAGKKTNNEKSNEEKLNGISGWLILPAISFIIGPIINAIALIASLNLYSDVVNVGYGGIFTTMLIVVFVMLIFQIYVAKLFFTKKSNAPSYIIKYLSANVLVIVSFFIIGLFIEEISFTTEFGKVLIPTIIGAAIWIPYFIVSQRVKATFTR